MTQYSDLEYSQAAYMYNQAQNGQAPPKMPQALQPGREYYGAAAGYYGAAAGGGAGAVMGAPPAAAIGGQQHLYAQQLGGLPDAYAHQLQTAPYQHPASSSLQGAYNPYAAAPLQHLQHHLAPGVPQQHQLGAPAAPAPATASSTLGAPNKVWLGVVKTYNLASGFGFIRQEDLYAKYERDVFFNRMIDGAEKIETGMQVTFQVQINEKGQPQAVELKIAGKARKPPADKVFHGVIRTFNQNLGYGFINCPTLKEEYDRDVFVHKQQFEGLEVGDQVQFKVTVNSRGHPQARDVEKDTGSKSNEANETPVTPPDGKANFVGRLRTFHSEADYTFIDSDEAAKKFGTTDVFVHRSHCPKDDLLEGDFEFDIVLVKNRPQARNLRRVGATSSTRAAASMLVNSKLSSVSSTSTSSSVVTASMASGEPRASADLATASRSPRTKLRNKALAPGAVPGSGATTAPRSFAEVAKSTSEHGATKTSTLSPIKVDL
ncbi:unnamed protein product [Amoebophrya sp. A25]|nr:unnamed protein product [Amoebophrya sp. A25]|eukprot:GSA25T00009619001.1